MHAYNTRYPHASPVVIRTGLEVVLPRLSDEICVFFLTLNGHRRFQLHFTRHLLLINYQCNT